jgi:hypothetical protein
LQSEGSIDDIGVPGQQLYAGRRGRIPGGYRKSHADLYHPRRLDDVHAINGPWEAVVHAGADLRLDGTEPAYHRALVRPDEVESRGQMGSKKKDKNAKDPIAIAKPEAR